MTITENTINQPPRFSVGQKVRAEDYNGLKTQLAKVNAVEKGEEDWKFYVTYNRRDHMGRTGGMFFAEELESA